MSSQNLPPLTKAFVDEHRKNPLWETGNRTLYDLCKQFPNHIEDAHIIAKIWLIGRAYGAAIERRKKEIRPADKQGNDQFYETKVVSAIRTAHVDDRLRTLQKKNVAIKDILEGHFFLMTVFKEISQLNKRSLASKYLHFHFPKLFYIYDSRAVKALREILRKSGIKKPKSPAQPGIDNEYEKFFAACNILKHEIIQNHGLELCCREIDNILLRWAADHGY